MLLNAQELIKSKLGPVELDTGSALLDIGGIVFIVLAILLGRRLIERFLPEKGRSRKAK